jgi:hypothetical protein
MSEVLHLYNRMLAYGNKIKERELTPVEITKILRRFVGTTDIKIKTNRDIHVDDNQVIIGGCYDPGEDQSNFSSITIYVNFNPSQIKIAISVIDWPRLCVELIECVEHEKVHQRQYRKRKFDVCNSVFVSMSTDQSKKLDQEYLGSLDEIDAYSYSLATEIHLKYNPLELTYNYCRKSSLYKMYVAAFGSDHIIVKQFKQRAINYYLTIINS